MQIVPPLDAEKIGRKQLIDNFQWPPGLEPSVNRSTLIVGTRGSGKTMFLRHCRHKFQGIALYQDLWKIMFPLSNDTGAGGQSFEAIPVNEEPLVKFKAISLLAQWLFSSAVDKGKLKLDIGRLLKVLPKSIRIASEWEMDDLDDLGYAIEEAPLSEFQSGVSMRGFDGLLEHVAEVAQESDQRLILLLDRAEEVPYPGLTPIMNLLDQRHKFLAVVASRPGIIGPNHQMSPDVPTPGDHYNIRHLGSNPYSEEWHQFVVSVLDTWLPLNEIEVKKEDLDWIVNICRDSIRNALEILSNAVNKDGKFEIGLAKNQLQLIKNHQLDACQGKLRRLNNDLKKLLSLVKKRRPKKMLPVSLSMGPPIQESLFIEPKNIRDLTKDEQAIYIGLRSGFFTTLEGVTWHPYSSINRIEIPPIFLWEDGDKWSDT